MITVRVFDPVMCCSTGVCGPSIDPELARFAADLAWLKLQGVSVERFNLAQQPAAFAANAAVKAALETKGEAGLPLVQINDQVKSSGCYPSRHELAAWVGIAAPAVELPAKTGGCCGPARTEQSTASAKSTGCCAPVSSEASAQKKFSCC